MLRSVLLPTLIAAALLMAFVGAVLMTATSRSDRLETGRQTRLAQSALLKDMATVAQDQEASTLWDDAVLHVRRSPLDLNWLDSNLGIWFHTFYQHDETYVLDPRLVPVYAMQSGQRRDPRSFSHLGGEVPALARRLQGNLRGGYRAPVASGAQTIGVADTIVVGGRPAFVSLKPIVPESDRIAQRPGGEFIHVSLRYLDGDFLTRLARPLAMDDIRFGWTHPGGPAVPVANAAGKVLGYITWTPFQPGSEIARRMIPTLVLALAAVSTMIASLLLLLRRKHCALEESRAQAEHLSVHDPLTGLANRARFDERLAGAFSRSRRSGSLAVLMIDLDRFKHVNDTFGHPAGDALLCEFANRLTALAREGDTVARLGGDEFAIVVEHCPQTDIEHICLRILAAVARPFDVCGNLATVGASIGVAHAGDDCDDVDELIRRADTALYHVKSSGRHSYCIFSHELDDGARRRGSLAFELRQALASGEGLALHYRPVVRGRDRAIVGVKAMADWTHPQLGRITAIQFIPAAEQAGLVDALSEWVLREAALQSARWPHLFMGVGLPPSQLRRPEFCDRLLEIVVAAGANPARFELEITERSFLHDEELLRRTLCRLREAGFRIVLDNFGTGNSSLGVIQRLEVDKIRIDRSFVRNLERQAGDPRMVAAIIALGRAMNLVVSAAGVETPAQAQLLARAGCDQMQGRLFGPGIPADQFEMMLANPHPPLAAAG